MLPPLSGELVSGMCQTPKCSVWTLVPSWITSCKPRFGITSVLSFGVVSAGMDTVGGLEMIGASCRAHQLKAGINGIPITYIASATTSTVNQLLTVRSRGWAICITYAVWHRRGQECLSRLSKHKHYCKNLQNIVFMYIMTTK